jgi:hypothetical protein
MIYHLLERRTLNRIGKPSKGLCPEALFAVTVIRSSWGNRPATEEASVVANGSVLFTQVGITEAQVTQLIMYARSFQALLPALIAVSQSLGAVQTADEITAIWHQCMAECSL